MSVALGIQHAMRLCCVMLSPEAVPYFFKVVHKYYDLRKKNSKYKIFVLISLQILSEIFLIVRIMQGVFIINVHKCFT